MYRIYLFPSKKIACWQHQMACHKSIFGQLGVAAIWWLASLHFSRNKYIVYLCDSSNSKYSLLFSFISKKWICWIDSKFKLVISNHTANNYENELCWLSRDERYLEAVNNKGVTNYNTLYMYKECISRTEKNCTLVVILTAHCTPLLQKGQERGQVGT